MIEIIQDMMNPTYWVTVVPIGTAYLMVMWRRDSKMIAEQELTTKITVVE